MNPQDGEKPATPLIVSVSGIRGIVGKGLTPEAAATFAAALGTYLGGGKVAIGRDGRPSGDMLRHAVLAGLVSTGCCCTDLGVLPTPTCGFAIRCLGAAGGIQITASHNPAEWNGLKLFGPRGTVLTSSQGRQVQEIYQGQGLLRAAWNEIGSLDQETSACNGHRDRVLDLVDVRMIRNRRFRVLLDANGGAGGPIACSLLESLGCEVIPLHCGADGIFRHAPEPVQENLDTVAPLVPQHAADLGLVLDPDADRLAVIDETGRYIGEELTLALAVQFRLGQKRGPVVINMSTSRLVEDIARRFECAVHRSAVGEANVVELMQGTGAVIGGEGNGGVIDPRVGGVRDPVIGMAMILQLLAEAGRPLSRVIGDFPAYHMVKTKYPAAADRLGQVLPLLERRWPEARACRVDGLRLDWTDRWVHVRPSNTEPIVRVIAEAADPDIAGQLCRQVGEVLG